MTCPRIYALTNKSKILTTYIVILAVTKLVTPFVFPGVLRVIDPLPTPELYF